MQSGDIPTAPLRADVVLVAAGLGLRAGGAVPKQYRLVRGRAVVGHAVDALRRHPAIGRIVLVVADGMDIAARIATAPASVDTVVVGGATRQASVLAGLAALTDEPPAHVLIHDAARPFLPGDVIDRLLGALARDVAAIPVLPMSDSVVDRSGQSVDRACLWRVQTPQAFAFVPLLAAHRAAAGGDAGDDATLMRTAGHRIVQVAGDERLAKITTAADLARAEGAVGSASSLHSVRIGQGFDVHRLVAGETLWLGGIRIAHDRGLAGHSDADVVIHALVDALLGAIAAGDIGDHFPPSDPRWRGAGSDRFLAHALDLVRTRDHYVQNVDITIICEAPRIGPYKAAMRARLAAIMGLMIEQVSIKATTTERLGAMGRGEGIAAQAVACLGRGPRD